MGECPRQIRAVASVLSSTVLRLTRERARSESEHVNPFEYRTTAAVLALALSGCGGSLQVARVKSDQQKPNNVWVFFSVQKGKDPVAPIGAGDFEIYEDGQLVSKFESK